MSFLYTRLFFAFLLHLALYLQLRRCWQKKIWTFCYWFAALFFILIPFAHYGNIGGGQRWTEGLFALAVTEYVAIGVMCALYVFGEMLRFCAFLWGKCSNRHLERYFTPCGNAKLAFWGTLAFLFYGAFEAWNVRPVFLAVSTTKLPSSVERIRIVQLSDIHLGGLYSKAHLENVMKIVREVSPDILVITGDLVDGNMEHRQDESQLLAAHSAKYGAFAVTGNHEGHAGYSQAVEFIKNAGFQLLSDEAIGVADMVIVGIEEEGGEEVWPEGLQLPEDRFILLLKHYPEAIKGDHVRYDLQLSGHTHGGQVWPLAYSVLKRYGVPQGLSQSEKGQVYLSNGTGFWGAPIRFLTPPEVTVIDLVPQNKN